MKIEMMMIGAMAFGLIFVLGLNIYSDMLSDYNVDVDTTTTWGKISYQAKQIKDQTDNMRDDLQGGTVTDENAVDDMVTGGYNAIRNNPFSSLKVAANATEVFMQETHYIPAEVSSFLIATLAILVVFAIIALIFRFEQR